MTTKIPDGHKVILHEEGWEQVVMGEVLIPDTPNCYGDIYTELAIRDFAYEFAIQGYGIDLQHDNADVSGQVVVVESFIAREGDPTFIKGSWVVAMKILDPAIWQQVLDGQINGYSFEALVTMLPVKIDNYRNRTVSGVTSPDLTDGHTHTYTVVLDTLNNPVSGGTSVTDGHSHTISSHTYTDVSDAHRHTFQVIE